MKDKYVTKPLIKGNTIWAGTEGKGVFYSTNNGTNLTQTTLNTASLSSYAFHGRYIIAGVYTGFIYRSSNHGTNWVQLYLASESINTLKILAKSVFAEEQNSYVVYISTNWGAYRTSTSFTKISYTIDTLGNNLYAGSTPAAYTDTDGVFVSINNGTLKNIYLFNFKIIDNNN
jgi:hypothetical protein